MLYKKPVLLLLFNKVPLLGNEKIVNPGRDLYMTFVVEWMKVRFVVAMDILLQGVCGRSKDAADKNSNKGGTGILRVLFTLVSKIFTP